MSAQPTPARLPDGAPKLSVLPLGAALAAAVALVAAGRMAGVDEFAGVQTFVLIFASIVIEALPFILLGALMSALIAVYVPERVFARIARLPLALQIPGATLSGFAFPVCECGSVPVARRLITRGMHPAAGISFMLAAPVLNPIVLASTWVAYSGRGVAGEMLAGRAGLGVALAVVGGWAIGRRSGKDVLRARPSETREEDCAHDHDHGHDHEHGAHCAPARGSRTAAFTEHLAGDFLFMGKFIVLGAALAALLQTVVPQSIVGGIAGSPLLAPLALMGLAFMLSLCSEADAFVAVSLTAFPLASQLAFLVFGPILDTKLAILYGGTFRDRFVLRLALVAVPVVLLGSLLFGVFVR